MLLLRTIGWFSARCPCEPLAPDHRLKSFRTTGTSTEPWGTPTRPPQALCFNCDVHAPQLARLKLQPQSTQLVASTSIDLIDLSSADANASFNPCYKSSTPPGDAPPLPAHSLEEIRAWPGSPSPRHFWADASYSPRSATPTSPLIGVRHLSNRSSWSAPSSSDLPAPIYWELENPAEQGHKCRFVEEEEEERRERKNRRRQLDKVRGSSRRSSPLLQSDVWVPRGAKEPETLAPPAVHNRRSLSCEQLPATNDCLGRTKHRCPTPPRLLSPSLDAVQCEVVADI
jgi:hypothetical protein